MFTGLVTYGLKRFIYTIPKLCILPNHKKGTALVHYLMSTKKLAPVTSNAQVNDAVQLVVSYPKVPLTVDCVIFGFEENKLKVLLIKSDLAIYKGKFSLLGDIVKDNEELDDAAYRVLQERTGMKDVYLDQVKTFGRPTRHPGGRVITVAYCSLLNINHHSLAITANELHWHSVEDLEEMAFDHKEIVDACHAWLQKRIQEHPLGFNLLPEKFSLRELQNLYEAISGLTLDRRNFRKKFASMKLLIDINEIEDVRKQKGFLTADIEFVNHKGSNFYSANETPTDDDKKYYQSLNDVIKNQYKGNFNFRLGGELKFNTFMTRLGFAYYTNPYKDTEIDAHQMLLSGGIGYRHQGIFIDLTYVYSIKKDVNFPYRLEDRANTFASINNQLGNIILSVGCKF